MPCGRILSFHFALFLSDYLLRDAGLVIVDSMIPHRLPSTIRSFVLKII